RLAVSKRARGTLPPRRPSQTRRRAVTGRLIDRPASPFPEAREQPIQVVLDDQEPALSLRHEALRGRVVQVGDEGPEVAGDVKRADRLRMEPQLGPRQDLGQL